MSCTPPTTQFHQTLPNCSELVQNNRQIPAKDQSKQPKTDHFANVIRHCTFFIGQKVKHKSCSNTLDCLQTSLNCQCRFQCRAFVGFFFVCLFVSTTNSIHTSPKTKFTLQHCSYDLAITPHFSRLLQKDVHFIYPLQKPDASATDEVFTMLIDKVITGRKVHIKQPNSRSVHSFVFFCSVY